MASTNPYAYYRMSNLTVSTQTVIDDFGHANLIGTAGVAYSATNEFSQTVLRLATDTGSLVATSTTHFIIQL